MPGDHRTAALGPGTELLQVRPYQPGDDVRQIDWNVTARTQRAARPRAGRRAGADHLAVARQLALDAASAPPTGARPTWPRARRSSSATWRRGVATASACSRSACRAALAAAPARAAAACSALLTALRAGAGRRARAAPRWARRWRRSRTARAQRGLVVVVSDFRGPRDWHDPLLRLSQPSRRARRRGPRSARAGAARHRRCLALVDPETGRQLRVDTGRRAAARALRHRRRRRSAARSRQILRRAGVDHVVLSTAGDWLRAPGRLPAQRGQR